MFKIVFKSLYVALGLATGEPAPELIYNRISKTRQHNGTGLRLLHLENEAIWLEPLRYLADVMCYISGRIREHETH